MKFCKSSNHLVIIIFIIDSVNSSSGCSRYRDIAAITTLWPVECFPWSMRVHELDIYITLLLINFVHQTNPPKWIVKARDVRQWCNVTCINSSWNFEVMDAHKRVILMLTGEWNDCFLYRLLSCHLRTSSPSSLSPRPCLFCQCQRR